MLLAAALCALGGLLGVLAIRNPPRRADAVAAPPERFCALDGPPLRGFHHGATGSQNLR
jgi:hypothetical protein